MLAKKPTTKTIVRRFAVLRKDFPYLSYGGPQVIEKGTKFRLGRGRDIYIAPSGDLALGHWVCMGDMTYVPKAYVRYVEETEVQTVVVKKTARTLKF